MLVVMMMIIMMMIMMLMIMMMNLQLSHPRIATLVIRALSGAVQSQICVINAPLQCMPFAASYSMHLNKKTFQTDRTNIKILEV